MISDDFDPTGMTVLPEGGSELDGPSGSVIVELSAPEELEISTESVAPGALVVQRAFLPLYRATVDGQKAPIVAANIHRLGIEVPARLPSRQGLDRSATSVGVEPGGPGGPGGPDRAGLEAAGVLLRCACRSTERPCVFGPQGCDRLPIHERPLPSMTQSAPFREFKKVLVANRGEIAVRVIRALRDEGIGSAVIYSDPDRQGLAVLLADEAYRIGPAASRDSYLQGPAIVELAQRIGADAIHPGYGFLAENAEFAGLCQAAGVCFIGPSSAAIAAMGSKIESRRLITEAGVPIVPGGTDVLGTMDEAVAFCR